MTAVDPNRPYIIIILLYLVGFAYYQNGLSISDLVQELMFRWSSLQLYMHVQNFVSFSLQDSEQVYGDLFQLVSQDLAMLFKKTYQLQKVRVGVGIIILSIGVEGWWVR